MACAREEPPPGTRPDRTPPGVRVLKPDKFAVVPGFGGSAEVQFDEPISGARGLQQRVVASPAGRYEISAGFSNLKIRPTDGWGDGIVYHIRIPEGIADLLGNRTQGPIDLVFSTGPEISSTRVTGDVRRRVDGNAVTSGRVTLLNVAGDSIPYSAPTESDGSFELSYAPADDYWSFAFQDLNGNFVLDRMFEPYDSARLELLADGRVERSFRIVEPDTTPPILGRIEVVDTLSLELEFDDYLDPTQDFGAAGLEIRQLDSGRRIEIEAITLSEAIRGRAAGTPGARVRPDTLPEAAPDTLPEAAPDTLPEAAEPPPEEVLPSQMLLVRLASPLGEGRYGISMDRVVNLRQLAAAIDTVFAYPQEAPPAPLEGEGEASEPADSVGGDVPPRGGVR
jgi:hypothetical protein